MWSGCFRGVHEIKVTRCESSPQTVLWANFHVDSCTFWKRAVLRDSQSENPQIEQQAVAGKHAERLLVCILACKL